MRSKLISYIMPLVPVLVTGAVILGCARGPVLQEIPALLELSPVETRETEVSPEPIPSPKPLDELTPTMPEEIAPLAQGTGNYPDGVYTGTGSGYGGEISVQVTVENGQIVEIEILSAPGETASFFSRAERIVDSILTAQTWEVDGVSGATYSSNGIKAAVQNALTGETVVTKTPEVPTGNAGALVDVAFTEPEGGYADGCYSGSAQGFGGSITVQVTIEGGTITDITVLSASGETSSYFARACAVISSVLSAQSPNVDTVSGATYSSNGILNAVKAALAQASGMPSPSPSPSEPPAERPNYGYSDGTYTGMGVGFGGDVTVQVTVTGGQITQLEILAAEEETPEFLERAKGVLDLVLEAQNTQVDAVSGATFSSEGILEAITRALDTASDPSETPVPTPSETPAETPSLSATPSPEPPAPVVEAVTETYTGTGTVSPDAYEDFETYSFTLEVTVTETRTITVENGIRHIVTERAVTDCRILSADTDKTNQRYLTKAFSGMKDGLLSGGVDAVSGATCSSVGIQAAWDAVSSGAALGRTVEDIPAAEEGT